MLQKIKKDNESSARRAILEDLFYDFHSSKRQVYWMNFVRGIFFGVGSVIGATLIIGSVIWLLSLLVDLPGGVGNFVQYIVDTVKNR